ncbi:MAG: RodZ domain-containing protein [Alphaproteobacteria bacterium]
MVRLNPRSIRVLNQDGAPNAIHSVEGVDHVGAFLREARENTGRSVADVAQILRIRRVYLEAIEDGRFDELPGAAYAVGFIRSYATFLRLDVPTIVARFKEEASGIESQQDLDFPTPVPEGRFPGGVVVALCLVVAAAGLGGWYWWQSQNTIDVARVPPPPEVLTGSTDTPVAAVAVEAPAVEPVTSQTMASDAQDASGISEEPDSVSSEPSAVGSDTASEVPTAEPAGEVAATPEPETAAPTVPETVVESAPEVAPAAQPAIAVPAEPLGPNSDLNVGVALPPEPESASPPAVAAGSQTASATSIPGVPAAADAESEGRTYGIVNRDARIILSARETDTWVQVMDSQQNALLTQMLRAGDRYLVPNRPGLSLQTNNAGGLDILVDGTSVPTIGGRGDIRRDVRLDPELLKSGTAVIQ